MNRFEKQTILQNFGEEKQKLLQEAKVLIIGMGGLGCPALLYLAAVGIGTIGLVDGDTISISNLNRQVIFGENHVGLSKVNVASDYILHKYTDITIQTYPVFIKNDNVVEIIEKYDIVLDCTDNFVSRYLINDACSLLNKPLVFGAIYQYEGQWAVFNIPNSTGYLFNYRDLFPIPPKNIPDCNQSGVIGVLAGVIGTIQAAETIKYLAKLPSSNLHHFFYYHFLQNQWMSMEMCWHPQKNEQMPISIEELMNKDYTFSCWNEYEIDWQEAFSMIQEPRAIFLDVRETYEEPKLQQDFYQVPINLLNEKYSIFKQSDCIIIFCQTGKRSKKAVEILKNIYPYKKIFSVLGGINHLNLHKI